MQGEFERMPCQKVVVESRRSPLLDVSSNSTRVRWRFSNRSVSASATNAAVDEYRAIRSARERPNFPKNWNTEIPELIISKFTAENLAQVEECMKAIEPIEARGMTAVTRIELAAGFVASAMSHATERARRPASAETGPNCSSSQLIRSCDERGRSAPRVPADTHGAGAF
jgi:hypothetical protein